MLEDFYNSLLNNDKKTAEKLFQQANQNLNVIDELIVPAMIKIGELWEVQEISLSQIYLSSRIVENLVETILPADASARQKTPEIAIVALEDYHLMGKSIVLAVVKAAGYAVKDFGRLSVEGLQQELLDHRYDILLISALMLPSALKIEKITSFLKSNNMSTTVVVGGAPFNFDEELSIKVGADSCCRKAQDVIEVIKKVERSIK